MRGDARLFHCLETGSRITGVTKFHKKTEIKTLQSWHGQHFLYNRGISQKQISSPLKQHAKSIF